jgi:hypothetical protein
VSRVLDAWYDWAEDHPGAIVGVCLLTMMGAAVFVTWARHAHPLICGALLGFGVGRMRVRHLKEDSASSMVLLYLAIGVIAGLVWELNKP